MATDAPDRCPNCGAERPASAPGGHCPRCLLRAGLDGPSLSLAPDGAAATVALAGSRVLETLAASVGPVPRVLLRDTDPGAEPPVIRMANPNAADDSIRYRIDGEIARGGMGAVLKGRDPDLGRDVALKVLRDDLRNRPELVRRFVEEAQIGGQLQHPGIVPIYELGTFADRRPFFSMKLVKGQTLAALLAGRSSPAEGLPRFLGIFEQVAQTVAYAHARGVIHRDLKPSNVMVGSFGEVQVMDWGLAKVLPRGGVADDAAAGRVANQETVIATARSGGDSDAELSRAGSVLGTPAYMAPEQARGEVEAVDERADAFALGSILGEILTGQPAFTGRSSAEIQRKAARGETADALARLDASGADAELIALARDCLAAEAEDRPPNAGAVAARVTAYLTGVQERLHASERERAVAEARAVEERKRRRLQLGLAAAVLAITTLGSLGTIWILQQRQAHAARVKLALEKAQVLRDRAAEHPDDPSSWREALEGIKQTTLALADGGDPEARRRLEALRAETQAGLDSAARDQNLLARLFRIRLAIEEVGMPATDTAYAAAFREAGYDLDSADQTAALARLKARPAPLLVELASYIDDWARYRRELTRGGPPFLRLVAAARALDPDPDRDRLRALLIRPDLRLRRAETRALAEARAATLRAPDATILAVLLVTLGDREAAVALLRRAILKHPGDFWINYLLAENLDALRPPQREDALRYYTVARSLRPEMNYASYNLGNLLARMGRGDEAAAILGDMIERQAANTERTDDLVDMLNYAIFLGKRNRPDEARAMIGRALETARRLVAKNPKDANLRILLARALYDDGKGDLAGAIAEFREALRLQPRNGEAQVGLADALDESGNYPGAIKAYREALRLDPLNVEAHHNLGWVLNRTGDFPGAIAEYREALRLQPDLTAGRTNLSLALYHSGDLRGAIAELREAVRLQPDDPLAYLNLGTSLANAGDFAEALKAMRKGHELGSKQPGWPHPTADLVRRAERNAVAAERLAAFLRGEYQPKDEADQLALALVCSLKGHPSSAARLAADAFAAEPTRADDLDTGDRYNAACAAALAGTGQGQDDPPPDDAARARLRQQARDWLRADLALRSQQLQKGDATARLGVLQNLTRWTTEPNLAGIRDASALEKLPESERAAWRAFWEEVGRRLNEAGKAP